MISEILMGVGAIICIIGTITVILLGLLAVREFILDNFYAWKLSNLSKSYDYEAEMLAVIHLKKLKKDYPELEIHYKGEELQEWGD